MKFNSYADFSELSAALLAEWIAEIDHAAAARLPAYFALAGGSTPAPLYRQLDSMLAARDICNLHLVATDERWVADSDAQSNEGLFKQCMPLSYGKQWQLVSLKNTARTPEVAVEAISEHLHQQIPQRFNAVLLGMGTDGHIASLFPGAPTQHDQLDCLAALHPQTRQSRISLSLPRLLASKKIWLLITGAEKRQLLEHAAQSSLPISSLLAEPGCNIEVFWCP
ncbi:6-phosphogluconolactonase [Undibacterium sp. Ren11W]|uniref:6-phosphogluconolactonase n=1 Tax=Undibacterium sp. Ren11W TaxID=3413045 RepID=UPI003BF11637